MNVLTTKTLFSAQATAASQTSTSSVITLNGPTGYMSLQVIETGNGTGKWEVEYSNDGSNWCTPTGVSDIVTAHTKTSGNGSDGNDIYQIGNGIFKYMRVKVTETGGASALASTAILTIQ